MADKKNNKIGPGPTFGTTPPTSSDELPAPSGKPSELCKPTQDSNDNFLKKQNRQQTKGKTRKTPVTPIKATPKKTTKSSTSQTTKTPPAKIQKGKSVSSATQPQETKGGNKPNNLNNNKKNSGGASPGLSQNNSSHGESQEPNSSGCCNNCAELKKILFNKVTETESGHITETDDTPGGERLHVMHRSGTNFEILPRGSFTGTVVTDGWLSFYRDLWIHVDGFTNLTFDKGVKVIVNQDKIENSKDKNVNLDIKVMGKANVNLHIQGGNLNIKIDNGDVNLNMVDGDINIKQNNGNYNHYVNGDYNLEVTGDMHTVIGGDRLEEVQGFKEDFVYTGSYTLDTKDGIRHISEGDIEIQTDTNYKATIKQNYLLKIYENKEIYIGKKKSEWIDGKTTIKSKEHAHYSEGNYDITSNATQNYYASGIVRIYGNTNVDINGTLPALASSTPENIPKEQDIIEYNQYEYIENSFRTESRERDN